MAQNDRDLEQALAELVYQSQEPSLATRGQAISTGVVQGLAELPATALESADILAKHGPQMMRPAGLGLELLSRGKGLPSAKRYADDIREWARETMPESRKAQEAFATQIATGVGSGLGFMAGGVAGAAAKLPVWATTAFLGALVNSAPEYYEALYATEGDRDKAFQTWALNLLPGATEAVPISRMTGRILGRVNRRTGGALARIVEMVVEGGEEAAQEAAQSAAAEVIAEATYGHEAKALERALEGGHTGFWSGVILSALSMGGGRMAQRLRAQEEAGEAEGQPTLEEGGVDAERQPTLTGGREPFAPDRPAEAPQEGRPPPAEGAPPRAPQEAPDEEIVQEAPEAAQPEIAPEAPGQGALFQEEPEAAVDPEEIASIWLGQASAEEVVEAAAEQGQEEALLERTSEIVQEEGLGLDDAAQQAAAEMELGAAALRAEGPEAAPEGVAALGTEAPAAEPSEYTAAIGAEPAEAQQFAEAVEEKKQQPEFLLSFPGSLVRAPGVAQVKAFLKREMTSAGDLPTPAFRAKIEKEGSIASEARQVQFGIRDLSRATRKVYGKSASSLDAGTLRKIDDALRGEDTDLAPEIIGAVNKMRAHLDALSSQMIANGVVQGDMAATVEKNIGVYLHRSYRAFDDPKWAENVPQDVKNKAIAIVRKERPAMSEVDVHAYIDALLFEGKAADTPMALFASSKLGSKDVSLLKRRKGISPEFRALLGEYRHPLVNYSRSASKMAHLISNHRFLEGVREAGMGTFFHEKPTGAHIKRIAAEASEVMHPLNGLYTTPEIERAFRAATEKEQVPDWLRWWMKANGIAKYGKTILYPITHTRNFVGNVGFAVAQGHWDPRAWKKSVQAIKAQMGPGDTEAGRVYFRQLVELGVVDEGVRAEEVRAVIKDASLADDAQTFLQNRALRTIKGGLKASTEAYQAEDSFWKVFAFENEKRRYGKALPDLSEAELEQKVATIVRNTYPTYSLVPRGLQRLRRFPFVASFVSFPAEVFRVGGNTLRLIGTELKDPNPKVKLIGAQRLTGTLLAASSTAAIAAASRYLLGLTDDDDENARVFFPPWSQNHDVAWVGESEKGNPLWVDLGYTDPWSYLKEPVLALVRGEDWENRLIGSLGAALEPFTSEEIFTSSVLDVLRNTTETGGKVYNADAPFNERARDILAHIGESVTPGFAVAANRVYRGAMGKTEYYGKQYGVATEILAQVFGVRLNELDVEQSIGFLSRDHKRSYSNATRLLTSVLRNQGEVSESEIRAAHSDMEDVRSRAFGDLHKAYRAALALGKGEDEILPHLDVGKGRRVEIADGVYEPYQVTTTLRRSLLEVLPADVAEERLAVLEQLTRQRRPTTMGPLRSLAQR